MGTTTTTIPTTTTTSSNTTTGPELNCDELCVDQGEIQISDQCCSQDFCQCTNGEESYLTSCLNGHVFCDSWQACVETSVCQENENHCCDGNGNDTTVAPPTTNYPDTTTNLDTTTATTDFQNITTTGAPTTTTELQNTTTTTRSPTTTSRETTTTLEAPT